jgi:hypothetical protein
MIRLGMTACAFGLLLSCGSKAGSATPVDGGSDGKDGGSGGKDGGSERDAAGSDTGTHRGGSDSGVSSSCAPKLPAIAWTSPYAGWTQGVPTDPTFFPLAVWLQGSWHATELAGLGINIYVGNNAGVDPMAASDLATIKALGMYAIIGQDSVGLASKNDPTIIGWWMTPDEPDNAQADDGGYGPPVSPSTLVAQYQSYKTTDPTRPIWLGLGQGVAYDGWEGRGSNAPPESGYVPASDIIAFDIYPYNACDGDTNQKVVCGEFWLNAFGVTRLHQWSNRKQAVWTDFETTAFTTGGTGPTPAETASEVWLALIHEANGVLYFIDTLSPFREDGIFASPSMVTAVTALNKQVLSLAPELNSATIPGLVTTTTSPASVTVDTMVKANGSSLYIFSAVSLKGTTMAAYSIDGMTGNAIATVVGENRSVPITAGKFSDAFAANGVHIYQVDLSKVTCPP